MIQFRKILTATVLIAFNITLLNTASAQDGEALFNAKCSACHILGSDGTGPNLQGVVSRWEGEEDNLYEWVLNAPKVIALGESKRAQEVKDYSPTVMPIQNVTIDEAKAIIGFADTWAPPAPEVTGTPGGEAVSVVVPDYKKNLNIFYGLMLAIIALSIAVLSISKSTSALIKSDLFRERLIEQNKNKGNSGLNALLLLVGFTFLSSAANALSLDPPAIAEDVSVWLYLETSDLYVLLAIALLLLGFLLHMINMFFKVLRIIKPKKVVSANAEEKETQSNFTRILTGAVPVEEEEKIDLGHDYDGIRELDNPMPPWWLAGFFISIVFAVVYMFHFHILGTGNLQVAEYNESVAIAEKEKAEYLEKMAMNVDETNATLMVDNSDLMKGKAIFGNNCTVCHTESGGGSTGPNLTDDFWIYGPDIKTVFGVIKYGKANGMPQHESKLNPIQLQQVSSYVLHLGEVTVEEGGKEPQGDFYGDAEEEGTEDAQEESTTADVATDSIDVATTNGSNN